MNRAELGAEAHVHIPRPYRAQWGFLALAALSALACVIVLATAVRANPRASLEQCCIDPKIPRTCAGYREGGQHVRAHLYWNDNGKLVRGPLCPLPIR